MDWEIERDALKNGDVMICGVDEAGRGPLAGPVYAAAVILPFGRSFPGLDDSKKLSEYARVKLFDVITGEAAAYGIASASCAEIDEFNILQATYLAMNRAIEALCVNPVLAVIDGNRDKGIVYPSVCAVGGDRRSVQIAAASILAKVSRDRYMVEMAEKYPEYGFERNKGYGTKLHYEMLRRYGPSEIHRATFRLK